MPAPASRRIAAFAADYVVLAAYIAVLTASSFLFGIGQFLSTGTLTGKMTSHAMAFLSLTLPVVLYFTITESGGRAASLGKRLMGLRVLGPDGKPPAFPRAPRVAASRRGRRGPRGARGGIRDWRRRRGCQGHRRRARGSVYVDGCAWLTRTQTRGVRARATGKQNCNLLSITRSKFH